MPANASFYTFLTRSLRPTTIGINIAFLSALGLGLIEIPALIFNGAWSSLPGAVSLLFVGAMLYSLAFNLFFFVTRVTAALVSHLDRFWPAFVPGLVVFTLLGEPIARFLLLRFAPAETMGTLALGALFMLLALGLCLLVLHVFPLLRNINSSLMLLAAFAARLVALPVEYVLDRESTAGFLGFLVLLSVTGIGIYALLQIRFLQHLAPLHDSPEVPESGRRTGWAIACVAGGLLFYAVALSPPSAVSFVMYFTGASGLLFALHWSLTALSLKRMRNATDPLPLLRDNEPRWFLSAVMVLTLTAGGFAVSMFPNGAAARSIADHGVLSREVLTIAGFALDGDADGNSRWPGGDPDDNDPCVRLDSRGHCPSNPARQGPGETGLPGTGSKSSKHNSRVLITIAGKEYDPQGVQSLLTGMGHPSRPIELFLPDKSPRRALRALFQDLHGLRERLGHRQTSIFSHYAARGIRTVCGGYDGGHNYLSTSNSTRLDLGCQVHVPVASDARRPLLSSTTGIMLKKARYYRERYNVTWIHHDFGGGRESRIHPGDMDNLAKSLRGLPADSPAILVFMGAGTRAFADVYILGPHTAANAKQPHMDVRTLRLSLREILNRTGERWIRLPENNVRTIGTGDALRPAWFGALTQALGDERSFFTFTPRADGADYFDGITGAKW